MNHSKTEKRIPGTIGDKEYNKLEEGLFAIRNLSEALRFIGRPEHIDNDTALAIFGLADAIDEKAEQIFELIDKIACEPYEAEEKKRRPAA